MTDPTDNINAASSTSRAYVRIEDINPAPAYSGATTYGTHEDDSVSDSARRGDSDMKPYSDISAGGVKGYDPSDYSTPTIESSQSNRVYDHMTGAYDEQTEYRTEDALRRHWERVTPHGTYFLRDVDKFDDGRKSVHREYSDPATGDNFIHDYQQ